MEDALYSECLQNRQEWPYKTVEIPWLWDKTFYFQLIVGNFRAFVRLGGSIKLSNNTLAYIFKESDKSIKSKF